MRRAQLARQQLGARAPGRSAPVHAAVAAKPLARALSQSTMKSCHSACMRSAKSQSAQFGAQRGRQPSAWRRVASASRIASRIASVVHVVHAHTSLACGSLDLIHAGRPGARRPPCTCRSGCARAAAFRASPRAPPRWLSWSPPGCDVRLVRAIVAAVRRSDGGPDSNCARRQWRRGGAPAMQLRGAQPEDVRPDVAQGGGARRRQLRLGDGMRARPKGVQVQLIVRISRWSRRSNANSHEPVLPEGPLLPDTVSATLDL